jgi:hypothetical protein
MAKDPLMDVLQQATTDPEFREALKANPGKVLAEAGVDVPKGVDCEVLENTPDKLHIVLPPLVEEDELGGEALEARATKSALLCAPGEAGMVTLMPVCIVA